MVVSLRNFQFHNGDERGAGRTSAWSVLTTGGLASSPAPRPIPPAYQASPMGMNKSHLLPLPIYQAIRRREQARQLRPCCMQKKMKNKPFTAVPFVFTSVESTIGEVVKEKLGLIERLKEYQQKIGLYKAQDQRRVWLHNSDLDDAMR